MKIVNIYNERTYYKCFSVQKSQVYTPEGRFKSFWTTPDRVPHNALWLWDSVFHSLCNKYISVELSYDTLRAVFDTQTEDGFIPHYATPYKCSAVTQPPVLAWGLYKLYEYSNRKYILEDSYQKLKKYLHWNMVHRDTNQNYLYECTKELKMLLNHTCGMIMTNFSMTGLYPVKYCEMTINSVASWYMQDGVIYEFYDPEDRISPCKFSRKGKNLGFYDFRIRLQCVRDYGWSCCIYPLLLLENA